MLRSLSCLLALVVMAEGAIPLDVSGVRPGPIRVEPRTDAVAIVWNDEQKREWTAVFSLEGKGPLVQSIAQGGRTVVTGGRPQYWVETGKRRGGFDQFFDFPPSHPDGTRKFMADFQPASARVRTKGDRVEVFFTGLKLGIFAGGIAYTFYPESRLIQQEAVASTREPARAHQHPLARPAAAQRDGWRDRADPEGDHAGQDLRL